jgi:DNA-binding winged helix-turn-helix (wHTH) protein/tetratricopeptide (TPR) repeat protein
MVEDNLVYEFDSFRLIPSERQLLRDGQPVPLAPKAFDTLVLLVQNHGHALRKDDLMKRVWPETFVEESNLNHYISVLRKSLNNGGSGDGYVETVRGYGFRFNADVREVNEERAGFMVHRKVRTHVLVREEEAQTDKTTVVVEKSRSSLRGVALLVLVIVGGLAAVYFGSVKRAQPANPVVVSLPQSSHAARGPVNPEAQEAYRRGRYFWNKRTPDDILKAGWEFGRAVQIDPNYALAYVGLADCLLLGGAVPTSTESAKDLALKALALDESSAEAHATLAYFLGAVEWNWTEAEREFERSIALNPNYPTARHWHAYNLASLGRMDEAIAEIRQASELDPHSIIISTDVGHMLYLAGRFDEAIKQYTLVLQMNPDFRVARWRLGEAYIQTKRYEESAVELREAIKLEGRISELDLWMAHADASNGHRDDALQVLSRRRGDAEARGHAYGIALVYAALGDNDLAFEWLEKCLRAHDGQLALIKVEPMLRSLRTDSRYTSLLQRMNLPTT